MATWTLRCRGPSGQATLSGIMSDMPLSQFQALLAEKTGVQPERQELLAGFPPKPVQLAGLSPDVPLSSLPISNGDSITVRAGELVASHAINSSITEAMPVAGINQQAPTSHPMDNMEADDDDDDPELAMAIAASLAAQGQKGPSPAAAAVTTASASTIAPSRPAAREGGYSHPIGSYSHPIDTKAVTSSTNNTPNTAGLGPAPTRMSLSDGSAVVRRIIDADNSCLFNAVGYVMEASKKKAKELRQLIADTVQADPVTFNEGFLGMENEEYCKWILKPETWGGAIELSILSKHYGRQIAAYDIQTKRCDIYGQDAGYQERVMVLYDGLHYDALAVSLFNDAPEEMDITIFEPNSSNASDIEAAAAKLVEACHKARQFTDTANFTLRCGICQIGLKGEKEAVEHAKATGHQNFAEY